MHVGFAKPQSIRPRVITTSVTIASTGLALNYGSPIRRREGITRANILIVPHDQPPNLGNLEHFPHLRRNKKMDQIDDTTLELNYGTSSGDSDEGSVTVVENRRRKEQIDPKINKFLGEVNRGETIIPSGKTSEEIVILQKERIDDIARERDQEKAASKRLEDELREAKRKLQDLENRNAKTSKDITNDSQPNKGKLPYGGNTRNGRGHLPTNRDQRDLSRDGGGFENGRDHYQREDTRHLETRGRHQMHGRDLRDSLREGGRFQVDRDHHQREDHDRTRRRDYITREDLGDRHDRARGRSPPCGKTRSRSPQDQAHERGSVHVDDLDEFVKEKVRAAIHLNAGQARGSTGTYSSGTISAESLKRMIEEQVHSALQGKVRSDNPEISSRRVGGSPAPILSRGTSQRVNMSRSRSPGMRGSLSIHDLGLTGGDARSGRSHLSTIADLQKSMSRSEAQKLNSLIITFYGAYDPNYKFIVNGMSASNFIQQLENYAKDSRTILHNHNMKEQDNIIIKAVMAAIESARVKISINNKSLGKEKLQIQKYLIDVTALMLEPAVEFQPWGDFITKLKKSYLTEGNKKEMLKLAQECEQGGNTLTTYMSTFGSHVANLLRVDDTTQFSNQIYVVKKFIEGLSETWRRDSLYSKVNNTIRTFKDIHDELQAACQHEILSVPNHVPVSDHYISPKKKVFDRLVKDTSDDAEKDSEADTWHIRCFRIITERCARCGDPNHVSFKTSVKGMCIILKDSVEEKEARNANDFDVKAGYDQRKASTYVEEYNKKLQLIKVGIPNRLGKAKKF